MKVPIVINDEVTEGMHIWMIAMNRANILGDCNERLTAVMRVCPN
jgi:hypothetical protein